MFIPENVHHGKTGVFAQMSETKATCEENARRRVAIVKVRILSDILCF